MKKMIFTIFIFSTISLFCQPVGAYLDNSIKKGIEYYDALMFEEAIEQFDKVLAEDPKMAEVHQLRGMCYLKLGDSNEARASFQRAVAMDIKYNGKINPAIRYITAEQINELKPYFKSAIEAKPTIKRAIVKEVFTQAQQAVAESDYNSARRLFNLAVYYDYGQNKNIYNFLFQAGNTTPTSKAAILYNMALMYTGGNQKLYDNIGYKFIKLAGIEWPKSEVVSRSLQDRAAEIIGRNEVQKYFPPPRNITVFEKTYDCEDAFEKVHCQIYVIDYRKVDIQVGDDIEIVARIKGKDYFEGQEIGIWLGKNFNPKWAFTKNGYYKERVEVASTDARYFAVSLVTRKDVEVIARVKKTVIQKPNIALLNQL